MKKYADATLSVFTKISFKSMVWLMATSMVVTPWTQLYSKVDWKQQALEWGFTAASYLSDPLLTAHRWRWQIPITHLLYPLATQTELCARKFLYGCAAFLAGSVSIITTPVGILMRYILIALQSKPFLYCKGVARERTFTDSFSLLSWNFCCVPGGYSITDGGVLPWLFRIHRLIEELLKQDADVISLSEIFDIQTAHYLIKGLKDTYAHFYYCIGPKGIGPSSGLFVASKIEITNQEFTLYPKKMLDGRAKHSNKGFLKFKIQSSTHATPILIYTTHMGHSEVPDDTTLGEVSARRLEGDLILAEMNKHPNSIRILTGDLNLNEKEFHEQGWSTCFNRGTLLDTSGFTWGGDKYAAENFTYKKDSKPSTLDYTAVYDQPGVTIFTKYIETGFDAAHFKLDAFSDHKGVYSTITFLSAGVLHNFLP